MKILSYLVALGVAGLGVVQQAKMATALDFYFTYTAAGVTTSGIFQTTATQNAGEFTITGISGTRGGTEPISYLAPRTYGNNDNKLYTNTNYYFTNSGVSYATNNGAFYNIYSIASGNGYYYDQLRSTDDYKVTLDNIVVQQVPFELNRAEGAALGVPLFIGLGMLRKKVARKLTASKNC